MTDKTILLIQNQDGRLLINPKYCSHIKTDYAILPESFSDEGMVNARRVDFCLDCRLVMTPEYELFHRKTIQQKEAVPEFGSITVNQGSETG